MKHLEFIRLVPQAETAILMIHGIIGTPNHFTDFVSLIPPEISVWNLLLDGHGSSVSDFSHSSMKIWREQVQQAVDQLCETHKQIVIVAHSMGTLFALQQAVRRPKQVKTLFLLACPLKIFVRWGACKNAWHVFRQKTDSADARALAAQKACGTMPDKKLWRYLGWLPRYMELFSEIRATRKVLPQVTVPCRIFQSRRDELVSMLACKLLQQNENLRTTVLEHSGHYYYHPTEYQLLLDEFEQLLQQHPL